MANNPKPLAQILKEKITATETSLSQLARECGVAKPILSRFVRDQQDLSLRTVQKLMDHFGLRVEE